MNNERLTEILESLNDLPASLEQCNALWAQSAERQTEEREMTPNDWHRIEENDGDVFACLEPLFRTLMENGMLWFGREDGGETAIVSLSTFRCADGMIILEPGPNPRELRKKEPQALEDAIDGVEKETELREERILIMYPAPEPEWLKISNLELIFYYAMRTDDSRTRPFFEQEVGKIMEEIVPSLQRALSPTARVTYCLEEVPMEEVPSLPGAHPEVAAFDPTDKTWFVVVHMNYTIPCPERSEAESIAESLNNAWRPRLQAALEFVMPFEDTPCKNFIDDESNGFLEFTRFR